MNVQSGSPWACHKDTRELQKEPLVDTLVLTEARVEQEQIGPPDFGIIKLAPLTPRLVCKSSTTALQDLEPSQGVRLQSTTVVDGPDRETRATDTRKAPKNLKLDPIPVLELLVQGFHHRQEGPCN